MLLTEAYIYSIPLHIILLKFHLKLWPEFNLRQSYKRRFRVSVSQEIFEEFPDIEDIIITIDRAGMPKALNMQIVLIVRVS